MKAFLLPLIIVLTAPFLQNCGTPDTPTYECTPDITVPFPQDALDRFYFKTGSWWVYEEINNPGVEDSVWVVDHKQNTIQPDKKVFGEIKTRKCYDSYNMRTTSSHFGEARWFLQIYSPFDGFNYPKELFEVVEQPIGKQYVNRAMLFGNSYTDRTNYGDNTTLIDSMMVKSMTYYEVLYFEKSQNAFDYLMEAWYARNIGLIKYKRADGSEWELVRYSVVQ